MIPSHHDTCDFDHLGGNGSACHKQILDATWDIIIVMKGTNFTSVFLIVKWYS